MRPDLGARRLIIAAYLYYNHAQSIISDASYDKLSKFVADEWDWVEPIRQWQLGSPEEILASGHHIKITQQGEDAALGVLQRINGRPLRVGYITGWQLSPEWGCLYGKLSG